MSIKEKISNRIKECMKEGNSFERDILKTVLGEIQSKEASSGTMSDEACEKVFKKFKQGVEDTVKIINDNGSDAQTTLYDEMDIYDHYITPSMSISEITEFLKPYDESIREAKSDGQATGIAMGLCKKEGLIVDGKDVSAVVKEIRS